MPINKLKTFLDDNDIEYIVISHSPAFTAQKIAAAAHIKGKDIAKTVMTFIGGRMAMVVLPASKIIDFDHLKEVLGSKDIRMASEQEFKDFFPSCETGAMPPFGNLYDMDVFVDQSLVGDHEIAFNAGSHTELIQMQYRDYEKLVVPKIISFTRELV
jgi:Ala-tRNA(Pro) deacylase